MTWSDQMVRGLGEHVGCGSDASLASVSDIQKHKASGSRGLDGSRDLRNLFLDDAPVVCAQNEHRNLSAGQVLLIADFLVRRDEEVKPGFFGRGQQCTVLQARPSLEPSGNRCMSAVNQEA